MADTHVDTGPRYDTDNALVVEPHGIEHIRDDERHSKPYFQGSLWFAANISFVVIFTGSLGAVFGLGFWPGLVIIALAAASGGLVNSACVVMGPRLGMPQMVISRAAFGYRGNYLMAFLATLLLVGYFVATAIVGAQTGQQLWPSSPYLPWVVLIIVVAIVITIFGFNMLHAAQRYFTVLSIVIFVGLTIAAIAHGLGPASANKVHGTAFWGAAALYFMVLFAATAGWAVYASDYSRYLPSQTPVRRPFAWSWAGMFIGTVWMQALGMYLGSLALKGGVIAAIQRVSGVHFGDVVYVVIVLGSVVGCVLNAYSGSLSSLAWDLPLRRTWTVVCVGAVGILLSLVFGGAAFSTNLINFLSLIAYFVTPWAAIVLIDFWILNRGARKYGDRGVGEYQDWRDFYRTIGRLGGVRVIGLVAFLAGVLVSIPFMANYLYVGPIGHALNGADLSYLVSALVAGLIYYFGRQREIAGTVGGR